MPEGTMSGETAAEMQRVLDALCDAMEQSTSKAMMVLDRMETEPDCKAMLFAWACAHGEP